MGDGFAERMQRDSEAVETKIPALSGIFARRLGAALVDLKKNASFERMTRGEIQKNLEYEDWRVVGERKKDDPGFHSDLDDIFDDPEQPEAFIFGGKRISASNKSDFFKILADKVHEEFTQVEPYKNVAGVIATRINQETGLKEILLVKGANDAYYFPGGKEDKKYPDDADSDPEGLEEAVRRETEEELGSRYEGGLRRGESVFQVIGGKRYMTHTFFADGISDPSNYIDVSRWKDAKDRTVKEVLWTNHPFADEHGVPRKLTEHARETLEGIGFKPDIE